jgi:hypothetical protein
MARARLTEVPGRRGGAFCPRPDHRPDHPGFGRGDQCIQRRGAGPAVRRGSWIARRRRVQAMCSARSGPCRIGGQECSLFSRSLDLPVGQQPLPSCWMRLAGRVAPPSPDRARTGGARGTPQMVPPVPGRSPLSPLDRVTQRGAALFRHRDVDRVGHHGEAPVRKPDRLHGRVVGVGPRHRLRGAPVNPASDHHGRTARQPWPPRGRRR